ncbi:MAG: acireductone synthase [Gammaproteobacteria bacterium]|nr:acireductone synthase [Gammaproteobacteria bacterium]MCF6229757.1 acireductone synthase [Gammaproteobacteria bacterium]
MIKAVVTDIEGTTTSISFVHETLFPYARKKLAPFIRQHADEPAVAEQLAAVSVEVGHTLSLDEAIHQLAEWMDDDKKITPLKALQGMLWQQGYENGDYQGHVYPDAYEKLKQWAEWGVLLYVYSSGSVKAQQLLFAHTEFGDMRPLFSGYFDTQVGSKGDPASYRMISEEIGLPAAEILFLSDLQAELDAATAAGMSAGLLLRGAEGRADAADVYDDFYGVTVP